MKIRNNMVAFYVDLDDILAMIPKRHTSNRIKAKLKHENLLRLYEELFIKLNSLTGELDKWKSSVSVLHQQLTGIKVFIKEEFKYSDREVDLVLRLKPKKRSKKKNGKK